VLFYIVFVFIVKANTTLEQYTLNSHLPHVSAIVFALKINANIY